jgi:hypothetical protein
MNKDLTESPVHRRNVLNNRFALQKIEGDLALGGIQFRNEPYFTKRQVTQILAVDERTIERYVSTHEEELTKSGYVLLKANSLKEFKQLALSDIDVAQSTVALAIFSFKSVLNLAMLLKESDRAREIRSRILDIVIDVIAQKAGGHTKYINQRDESYLYAAFQEDNYRKDFTDAIDRCIDTDRSWKYGKYTNLIYKAIFEEDAQEYRKILNLSLKDKTRDTFYSEVLVVIASFEAGFAEQLDKRVAELGRKLSLSEADALFEEFAKQAAHKPYIEQARGIMSSRDLSFRDALHEKLKAYIRDVPEAEYERFLGEKSKELQERIDESLDVYKRLRDR